jgi:hypothetical protein
VGTKPEFAFGFTTRHFPFIWPKPQRATTSSFGASFLDNLPYADAYSGVPGRKIVIINPDPLVRDQLWIPVSANGTLISNASHFRRNMWILWCHPVDRRMQLANKRMQPTARARLIRGVRPHTDEAAG